MTDGPATTDDHDALIAAGAAHLRAGRSLEARSAFSRAAQAKPGSAAAWRGLANALHAGGDKAAAGQAHLRALQASRNDPELVRAAKAVGGNRLQEAYPLLRDRLAADPNDVAALRIMADLAARTGSFADAFRMLARAVGLAPGFEAAHREMRAALDNLPCTDALAEVDAQLIRDPRHLGYHMLKASLHDRAGDHEAAIGLTREIIAQAPGEAITWMTLGHRLKTVGRLPEAIDAYRRSLALRPANGEAWWSLANLKTFRFTLEDEAAIAAALGRPDVRPEDRFHLEFALGKASEDRADHARSFAHYAEGNRLRRAMTTYSPDTLADQRRRAERMFGAGFFAARGETGDPAPDPIFVVGMPRSGSTLVEQILASHPAVEGTMELDDLPRLVRRIDGPALGPADARYPEAIAGLAPEQCRALGEEYLRTTRLQRKTGRPRFVDKLPANFAHVGLIRAILPNAKVIDVRRHPLSCCFSCFKQHFARGSDFSYDLGELGAYYAEYARFMRLWDEVLPGYVHRIRYERLVEDSEAEVRRLLGFLGLPFDPACLRFYENGRAVRTPSSEQVRRPIFTEGLDQWRHYEPWLGPLKTALGEALAED